MAIYTCEAGMSFNTITLSEEDTLKGRCPSCDANRLCGRGDFDCPCAYNEQLKLIGLKTIKPLAEKK